MKITKFAGIIILFFAMFQAMPATAAPVVNSTFDADTIGACPSGWACAGGSVAVTAAQSMPASGKSVLMQYTTANATLNDATFGSLAEKITFQYWIYPMSQNAAFMGEADLRNSANTVAVAVRLYGTNRVLQYRNNGGTWVTVGANTAWSANNWYRVKVVADPATDIFDVYFYNNTGTLLRSATGLAFRTAVANLDDILFTAMNNAVSDFYIDSVKVTRFSTVNIIAGANNPSAAIINGVQQDVAMLQINTAETKGDEDADLTSVSFSATGTGDDRNTTAGGNLANAAGTTTGVCLYNDTGSTPGTLDGTDTALGTCQNYAANNGTVTFSGLSQTITAGTSQNWLLVYDMKPSPGTATANSTFIAGNTPSTTISYAQAGYSTDNDDTSTITGSAITGNAKTVDVPNLNVTAGANNPPASTVLSNAQDDTAFQINLAETHGLENVNVTQIVFTASGTGNDLNQTGGGALANAAGTTTGICLYNDVNNNGTYESGTDTPIGTCKNYSGDNGTVTFNGLSEVINKGTSENWILAYDFRNPGTALDTQTFRASITPSTQVTAAGAISGQVQGLSAVAINGNFMTVDQANLTVTAAANNPPAATINNFDQKVPVTRINVAETSGVENVQVTQIIFTATGTGNDWNATNAGNLANTGVCLYNDNGTTAGVWDAGDTLIGACKDYSANNGNVTFNGLAQTITKGTSQNWLLTYNFRNPGTAALGNTFIASITPTTQITSVGLTTGQAPAYTGAVINSNTMTVGSANLTVTAGANNPAAGVFLGTAAKYGMLQVNIAETTGKENVNVSQIIFSASGTGNDLNLAAGGNLANTSVCLYNDNGATPGAWDAGDTAIGACQNYSANNGTVTFAAIGQTIAAGTSQKWLLVYTYAANPVNATTFIASITPTTQVMAAGAISAVAPSYTGAVITGNTMTADVGNLSVTIGANNPIASSILSISQDDTVIQINLAETHGLENVNVTQIVFTASGTGNDMNQAGGGALANAAGTTTGVCLYNDVNNNGTYESGTDTPIGTCKNYSANNGTVTFNGLAEVITKGTSENWILVYDFRNPGTALDTQTFIAGITPSAQVTAAGAVSGQVQGLSAVAINGNALTVNQSNLTVTAAASNPPAATINNFDQKTPMARINVAETRNLEDVQVTQIIFTATGTGNDWNATNGGNLANTGVCLYNDNGTTAGVWDAGDTLIGACKNYTANNGNVTFNGLAQTITKGTSQNWLLTYNFRNPGTAALGNTFIAGITPTTQVTSTGLTTGQAPTYTGAAITGNTMTVGRADLAITVGANNPLASSILSNAVNDAALQINLAETTGRENVTVTQLIFTAFGSGNDWNATNGGDMANAGVCLYNDVNNNGSYDAGTDTLIGACQNYSANNGNVTFSGLAEAINAGSSENWIVVYTFRNPGTALNATTFRTAITPATQATAVGAASALVPSYTGAAITGNFMTVTQANLTVTAAASNPPAATINNFDQKAPMARINVAETSGLENEQVTQIIFTASGTGNDWNATNAGNLANTGVCLYNDNGTTAGVWDAGDTLIGACKDYSANNGTVTFNGLSQTITKSTSQNWLLTYNFRNPGTAALGNTFISSITPTTQVTAAGVTTGQAPTYTGAAITGNTMTVGRANVTVTAGANNPAAGSFANNTTKYGMLQVNIAETTGKENVNVTQMIFSATGTGNDLNLAAGGNVANTGVCLYNDNGTTPGAWDASDTAIGACQNYSANNGTVTLTGLAQTVTAGTSQNWLLVYTYAGNAANATTFIASITPTAQVTAVGASSAIVPTYTGTVITGNTMTVNTGPSVVASVTLKSDATYATNLARNVEINDVLYIQLNGTDGNPSGADTTTVTVKSSITDTTGITVTLTETGANTGIYRNTATIMAVSNQGSRQIGAATNETVTVRSAADVSKSITATVNTAAAPSIITVTAAPTQVSKGQTGIPVSFTVNNPGAAAADVSASTLTFTNNADFVVTPSPSNPTQLAGGASGITFNFTVDVKPTATAGANTINGSVTATDHLTGANVSDNTAQTTDSWQVMSPGVLASSIIAAPAGVNPGGMITVTMTVNNTGGNTVNTVAPSALTIGGSSSASLVSGPAPASANITSSGNQQFVWTYQAAGSAGTVNFTGNASGTDPISGQPISSTSNSSNNITIASPAALSSSISAAPSSVVEGQTIIVAMRVNNTGGATANNTAPTALTLGGTSSATKITGPSPASANIAGGAYQDFTWTYQAASINGTVSFSGSASGVDSISGQPVSSTGSTSNNVTVHTGSSPADAWWDPSWTYRMPVTLTKPGGFEGARYSNHMVDYTINFAGKGFDNIETNSLRLIRNTGSALVEVPIDVKQWLDADADGQKDGAEIWFAIDKDDLRPAAQSATYYLYYDVVANGAKAVKTYPTLATLTMICLDTDVESQVCEELALANYRTIDKIATTVVTATGISDLNYNNLISNYDLVFFGWNAISNDLTYRLSAYENDIKDFVRDGGKVISAGTDNAGWQSGWLPDPGSINVVDSGSTAVTANAPYTTDIFNYPDASALTGITTDEYHQNVDGAGWIIMAQGTAPNAGWKVFLRKNWGIGDYIVTNLDERTTALAATARKCNRNGIYWAWRYENAGMNLVNSLGGFELYTPDSLTNYASDYTTHITTARLGDTMYIQMAGDDINSNARSVFNALVFSTSDSTGITVPLTESTLTSGIYRGTATLAVASNQAAHQILADTGDTVTAQSVSKVFKTDALTATSTEPTTVTALDIKSDATYQTSLTETLQIGSLVYIQVNGTDGNPLSTDVTTVHIISTSDAVGINVKLTETGRNTGIYRGTAMVANASNDTLGYIAAQNWTGQASTITVTSNRNPAFFDTCIVQSTPPTSITSVKFLQSDYSTDMTTAAGNANLYIELDGVDGNPYGADSTTVNVKSSVTDSVGIGVQVTETGPNTGIYRGTAAIKAASNDPIDQIGAQVIGETVTIIADLDATKTDTLTITNTPPATIASLVLKTDATYATNLATDLKVGNTLYVQLNATDANSATKDATTINIKSSVTDTTGISVTLNETTPTSGIFRGTAVIKPASNDPADQIGANVGETIALKSLTDQTKTATVNVISSSPTTITSIKYMDSTYTNPYAGTFAIGQVMYIEVIAADLNPESRDTTTALVSSTSDPSGISVLLTESGNNTGKFRGIATVAAQSDDAIDNIKGMNGDIVTSKSGVDISKTITASVVGSPPKGIFSVNIYQSDYTTPVTQVKGGDVLYIEARGVDGNAASTDKCSVQVTSTSDATGITVSLTEQAAGTAYNRPYRGTATVRAASDEPNSYIKAVPGDSIKAKSNDFVYLANGSNEFWFEGEGANRLTPNMTAELGSNTSGGQFIETPQGQYTGAAEYVIYKSTAGSSTYYLFGRVYPIDATGNTFYSDADGGAQTAWSAGTTYNAWTDTWMRNTATTYALAQGAHVIRVSNTAEANDGVRLDKAMIKTNVTAPTGFGSAPITQFASSTVSAINTPPTAISSVTLKTDGTYATNLARNTELNDVLYVQLNGTDGNQYTIDTTTVTIKSSVTDPAGITLTLTETGLNTGIYRGTATIKAASNQANKEIGAATNETVTAKSTVDTGKFINVTVDTPALLQVNTINTTPTQVNRSQTGIAVTMTVSNTGSAIADITAALLSFTNNGDFTVTPSPSNPTQMAGNAANVSFSFLVDVKSTAALGMNTIDGTITANDHNTGVSAADLNGASTTDSWQVMSPGSLSSTISAAPLTVSSGQQFTVTMTVTNGGGAPVNNTAPTALTLGGTSNATLVSGPAPANANIGVAGQQQFTWTYSAGALAGTVHFTGFASGTDSISGLPVSSSSSVSNDITIQTAAALSATIAGAPSNVAQGQSITVTMRVTNSGQAAANNTAPSALTLGGTSSATKTSGPTPASASIPGGGYQDFAWTYTSASQNGTVNFTGGASGTDANSGLAVAATNVTSNDVTIQVGAALSATMSLPTPISTGQNFTVTMTVTNSGQGGASNVAPGTLVKNGTSNATLVSGPTPANAVIPGGGQQQFTWVYQAGASGGNLNESGKATGNDALSGLPISSATATSNTALVQLKASLSSNPVTASPITVSTGQDFSIIMRIKNNGQAQALAVSPTTLTFGGTATATLKTGPSATNFLLPGGTFRDVTWWYTAGASTGTVNLTGFATGTDQNSSQTVSAPPTMSNDVTIQQAGALVSALALDKTMYSNGAVITITNTVTNTGVAAVNNVVASALIKGGTGDAVMVSGPTPASANIPGGGQQQYSWTYTASVNGTIRYEGYATGTDVNSGKVVTSVYNWSPFSTIQSGVVLTAAATATPVLLGVGETITVTMKVTNTGQATANNTTPSALTIAGGTGNAVLISGPTPANATLAGGASQTFTWTYNATANGTANFSGTASATDADSGLNATSSLATTNNVTISASPDAALVSTINGAPSTVSTNQNITVTMNVINSGQADATSVIPSALTLGGAASATLVSGPTPASQSVLAGGNAHFTWTYTASTNGTLNFTGNVSGHNEGVPPPTTVSSVVTTSPNVTVQSMAALSSSITVPATINRSQQFTATMTVTNTGGAAANIVAPSALTVGGTGTAVKISGPTPASATFAGGGQQKFTWVYQAGATSGTANLTGNAAGTDSNSGNPVSSTSNTSPNCTIQSAAALGAAIASNKYTVSTGQIFTLTMTVNNTGEETANAATPPSSLTIAGMSTAIKASGPTPANATIAGGGQQQYTWTYTSGAATGTLTLAGKSSATGFNSNSQILSATATTPTITVVKAATLINVITAAPGQVSVGQNFTVTMTITNTGEATANAVAPSTLTMGGTGTAIKISGPSPASSNITMGQQKQYTWTYQGTAAGSFNCSGSAAGTDANTGLPVSSNTDASDDIDIKAPAGLSSAITASPAVVSYGQQITVAMTVTNSGGAAANAVAPSALTITGGTGSNVTLVDGPSPANQQILGGASATYTWHYTAGAAAVTLGFRGNASGTDANSGLTVSSTLTTSNNVQIQSPAQLSSTIVPLPTNSQPGGIITVTMTVNNTGSATATNVVPSSLTVGGSSTANYTTGPTPASVVISGGKSGQFVWTFTASANFGTVNFTGNASGKDINTNLTVISSISTSDTISITNLVPLWVYPASGAVGPIRSSASIRKNTVYIGSDDNNLYAINSASGTLKWTRAANGNVVSTPFPTDDGNNNWTIYFGSNGNYVYAVTENNGQVPGWPAIGVNVGNSIISTTVSDGDNIFFGCYDNRMHAVSVLNGSTTWTSPTLNGMLISSPAVGLNEVYIGSTDGKLYAINRTDGTYLRSFNTGGAVEDSPWEDMDGKLYVGSDSGKFYRINASNFSQDWVYPATGTIGAVISSPWVEHDKSSVYFGSNDGKIYGLNKNTGVLLTGYTPYQTGDKVRSSPLVWKNILYAGSDNGNFYALNSLTGALIAGFPFNTGGYVYSSPSLDYIDGLHDRIVIGSASGKVFSFNAK